jgi:hypothetical protein
MLLLLFDCHLFSQEEHREPGKKNRKKIIYQGNKYIIIIIFFFLSTICNFASCQYDDDTVKCIQVVLA